MMGTAAMISLQYVEFCFERIMNGSLLAAALELGGLDFGLMALRVSLFSPKSSFFVFYSKAEVYWEPQSFPSLLSHTGQ